MTISLTVPSNRYILSADTARAILAQLWLAATRVTSRMLALCVGISLGGGTVLSMVTTRAHGWWNLHFSELGTYTDFSGRAFNGTLIVTGLIIVAFAVRLHVDMRALTTLSAWMTRVVLVLFTSLGINLLGVGVVPLNTNEVLHDRGASGVTLSFLCLLILVTARPRRFSRRLIVVTVLTMAVLAAVIVAFSFGIINLALLEIVAFPLIIGWSSALVRCVHQDLAGGTAVTADGEAVQTAEAEGMADLAGVRVAAAAWRERVVLGDARAALGTGQDQGMPGCPADATGRAPVDAVRYRRAIRASVRAPLPVRLTRPAPDIRHANARFRPARPPVRLLSRARRASSQVRALDSCGRLWTPRDADGFVSLGGRW